MIYAQLDENNICIGVCNLSREICNDKMIELSSYDISVVGRKYENSEWSNEVIEVIPEPEPQPTNSVIAQTQLTMMEAMADQYEQNLQNQLTNMEVQATIYETLLEQGGTTI